jgi:Zn-dependent protease
MDVLTMTGVTVVAVLSITSHEAAHGFVADRLGDPTARERGRLTLNPIPHIDLFFTILLPALYGNSMAPFHELESRHGWYLHVLFA